MELAARSIDGDCVTCRGGRRVYLLTIREIQREKERANNRSRRGAFRSPTAVCHICKKDFWLRTNNAAQTGYLKRVRDHDHSDGTYIGPAHWACNINRHFKHWRLPCFSASFRTDSHFVLRASALGMDIHSKKKQVRITPGLSSESMTHACELFDWCVQELGC